jgi:signal transduction histidine kinase/ActR/RegA family two-component response regulator
LLSSLRVRLLVPVLVAVVPTFGVGLYWVRAHERQLSAKASEDATALAQLVGERHQRSVDAARGVLLALASMPAVIEGDGPACSASLAPVLEREPHLVNLGAVRADGQMFCSAAPQPGPIDLSDRAFYLGALRTGGLGVGEYVVSRVRGTGALGFGYPVSSGGRTVAVAYASLAVTELQRELDALALPPGAEVAVLDRRGVTLSARPDGAAWAGRPFEPRLVEALRRGGGRVRLAGTDGAERTFALREVTAPDGTVAMYVLAGIPTGALLEPVQRVSRRGLLVYVLAAALALGGAVLMAELMLVRRLRRLAAASRGIAAGDWSARSGLAAGRDELGQLGRSFDEMARSLAALDREKREREEQLRQGQKLEAVGRLAGGMAHDFNNLLTVMLSAAESLQRKLPQDHVGQELAGDVVEAGERAAALTRQLLAFARKQPLAPRVVDLAETVRFAERLLRRVLGEPVVLEVEVRAAGRVRADPGQLELALLNLAVNARDAMPGGGRLLVVVDELEARDERRPDGPGVPAGPLAVLTVRDDGQGMDEGVRARIFEPFFTTKSAGRGTGLGLSTVQAIVREAGGTIRVDSAPGKGTEFRIYLPRHAGELEEVERLAPAASRGGSETILLVEDDERLRAVVRRSLVERGYHVLEAPSAGRALEIARDEVDGPVDLVLTDVILSRGNGVELAAELGRAWPGVPVIFMSGYTGDHLPALDALPADARFLPKPFTPDVLVAAVRAAIEAAAPRARAAT